MSVNIRNVYSGMMSVNIRNVYSEMMSVNSTSEIFIVR